MLLSDLRSHFPVIGMLLLAVVFGYLLGRLTTKKLSIPVTPITVRESSGAFVPVVRVDGVVNGEVRGAILGEARFFLGGHPVVPDGSGAFRVPATPLLTNIVTISVPEGMRFVASRRGKKYYPVDSTEGQNLAPINRIYFSTSEEAEGAGYMR